MSTWFSVFSHFVYSHPYIVLIFLLFFAGSLVLRNRYYVKTTKENLNYVLSWFSLLIPYACAICLDVDFVHNNILAAALPFMDSVCDFISLSEYLQKEPIIFIAEVAKVFVLSVAIEIVKNIFEKVFNKPERSSVKSFFLGVIPWYLGLFISVAVVLVTNFILSLVFDKISVNSIYHIYLGIFIICTIMFISYILLLIIKIFLAPLIPYVMPLIETIKKIFFINTTIYKTGFCCCCKFHIYSINEKNEETYNYK